MSLAFATYVKKIEELFDRTIALLQKAELKESAVLVKKIAAARSQYKTDLCLRIVLVGEFAAGKSSIISAMTGRDILIDADVSTTTVTEYPWQSLLLVDTPGVQAEDTQTDHDRITREAVVGADLILFVITNELFNPRLAEHLRFVLDDDGLGLAKKTCIIVNKIDRESNDDEILLLEVKRVLGPHQDVPILICSSSKFLQASKETDETLRARFERQSRFPNFIQQLNEFVATAGKTGRLTMPLSVINEVLEAFQSELAESDDDRNVLELMRRQQVVLKRLQARMLEIRKTWRQQALSTIMSQANDAVEQITEISRSEDLEMIFSTGMMEATDKIDTLYLGVESELTDALDQGRSELLQISESPFAQEVEKIEMKRAEHISIGHIEPRPGGKSYAGEFAKGLCKPLQNGLEEAIKDAPKLRDVVYNVGKKFGKNFRPYEAVKGGEKLAKWAGRAGKAMPYLTAALDLYLQYREEKAKEEKERYLAKLRLALRSSFAEQAKIEADTLEEAILKVSRDIVQKSLEDLDTRREIIMSSSTKRVSIISEIGSLQRSCSALRDELY